MSPEQACGQVVDRRTDIWAFGCVLYEMLTSKPAFRGETVSETLADVMKSEPLWEALPPGTPVTLRNLVRRCLEKDPRQRVRDIGDVRLALEGALETAAAVETKTGADPRLRVWQRPAPLFAGIVTLIVATVLVVWTLMRPAPPQVVRWTVTPSAMTAWAQGERNHWWPEVLPGGQAVLFTISTAGGADSTQIAVLDLRTRAQKVLIRGGSHARYVPTGHVVYGVGGTLRAVGFDLNRLEVVGTPVPVSEQVSTTGLGALNLSLSRDGTLVYVPGRVAPSQGTLVWMDRQGREETLKAPPRNYAQPRLSPDGARLAVVAGGDICGGRLNPCSRKKELQSVGNPTKLFDWR